MSKFQEFEAKVASNRPLAELLENLDKIRAELIANSKNPVQALGHDTVSLAGSSLSTAQKEGYAVGLDGRQRVVSSPYIDPANPLDPQGYPKPEVTLSKALPNRDKYGPNQLPTTDPNYPNNPQYPNNLNPAVVGPTQFGDPNAPNLNVNNLNSGMVETGRGVTPSQFPPKVPGDPLNDPTGLGTEQNAANTAKLPRK